MTTPAVGDRVRIVGSTYTVNNAILAPLIGRVGEVTAVDDVSDAEDVLGFTHIYEVAVRPYSFPLIDDDFELVERRARITG